MTGQYYKQYQPFGNYPGGFFLAKRQVARLLPVIAVAFGEAPFDSRYI
ncbi:MAG: hypothetical protein RQM95_00110 [Syntrophaceticus schinkii]|jgi:hypothetical protein|nr:hypothetical protein [Syntrophaceticus schinkii]MDD4261236.1 hypothetical protein [Syntrophaceticus schinkii]